MYFEEALLQKLKRCDFVRYFKSIIPDVHLEQHGNYYTCRCPHPDHEDIHPSFRIWHNTDGTWSFACMSCHNGKKDDKAIVNRNYGTDIIAFVRWLSDYKNSPHILTFPEAVTKLCQFFQIPVPAAAKPILSAQEVYHNKLEILYRKFFILKDSEPKKYFLSRGLSYHDAALWGIGSDGNRLIFPLYDADKRLKGFIRRTVCGEDPKYIHSAAHEGFIKSEFLYGMDKIDRSIHTAYITEGVFDVISAVKYGLKNVFACLGIAFKETHAKLLKQYNIEKVVFVFDNDAAGHKALPAAIEAARTQGLSVDVIQLDEVKDLDEFCQKYTFSAKKKLDMLQQPDYEYELNTLAAAYKKQRTQIQNAYLLPILSKAAMIQNKNEYLLYRNYVLTNFDVILEPKDNVREIKTDMADPVSAQAKAQTAAASTQGIYAGRTSPARRGTQGVA